MTTIRGKAGLKFLFFRWALYLNGLSLAHNLFRTTLDREYKALGLSNLLWSDDDFYDNKRHPKDPIYFYRLKSEKDLKKTSRYFLPSAKKPITNKIILALDIWGYFMTNWFWYLALYVFGFIFLANNRKSEADDKDEQSKWYDKIFVIGYIALLLMTFFY